MSCHQSWWRLVRPTESQTQTLRVWNLKKSEKEIRKKSSATTISLRANNLKKSEEKIGKRNPLNNLKKIPVRPVRRLHSEGRNWSWDSKVFVKSFRWNRLCLVAGITSGKTTKVHQTKLPRPPSKLQMQNGLKLCSVVNGGIHIPWYAKKTQAHVWIGCATPKIQNPERRENISRKYSLAVVIVGGLGAWVRVGETNFPLVKCHFFFCWCPRHLIYLCSCSSSDSL